MIAQASRCLRRAVERITAPTLQPHDTELDLRRKTTLTPVIVLLTVVYVVAIPITAVLGPTSSLIIESMCLALCSVYFFFVYVLKTLPEWFLVLLLLAGLWIACFLQDVNESGELDQWTVSVVVFDMMLLLRINTKAVNFAWCTMVVFVVLKSMEEGVRYGLYDMWATGKEPPGPVGTRQCVFLLIIRLAVFTSDFTLTKLFATGMVSERDRAVAAVALAEKVASALVKFDLEEARKLVDLEEDKTELTDAFRKLLANLQLYRPYLPNALFQLQDETNECPLPLTTVEPPRGEVAIVFTDIQASSMLWRHHKGAMQRSLDLHNRVLRKLMAAHRGYEVKTIGDAFMIAFQSAQDACDFCMEAQVALYEAEWPEELGEVPLCQFVEGAWNGLRVRMGIHFGEVDVEVNPITGRADYFGSTVNIASRVEAQVDGGFTCVTKTVLDALHDIPPNLFAIGERELKGCGTHCLFVVVPAVLRAREGNTCEDDKAFLTVTRTSSGMSVMSGMSGMLVVPSERPRAVLRQVVGTVAQVRIDVSLGDAVADVNPMFVLLLSAAETTEASVVCVWNTSILLAWNMSKRCRNHQLAAFQYLTRIPGDREDVTVGMSTGVLHHGIVGTRQQRFIAGMSQCVELAGAMSGVAAWAGTKCMFACGNTGNSVLNDASLAPLCRPVDTWSLNGTPTELLEVNVAALQTRFWSNAGEAGWGWSREYREAFESKDVMTIRANAPDDAVLDVVCRCLADGTHFSQKYLT